MRSHTQSTEKLSEVDASCKQISGGDTSSEKLYEVILLGLLIIFFSALYAKFIGHFEYLALMLELVIVLVSEQNPKFYPLPLAMIVEKPGKIRISC